MGRTLFSLEYTRHGCPAGCLTVCSLKDIWVGSLQIKLLQTFLGKFLCECEFLFLWDKHSRVRLLGRMVVVRLISKGAAKLCPRVAVLFCIPTSSARAVQVPCILASAWQCPWFYVSRSGTRCSVTSHCGFSFHPPSG